MSSHQAARWAREADLPKSEAQALMAIGMLCYVGRDFATAGRMYLDSAALLRGVSPLRPA